MSYNLKDKVAIVTGAGRERGLGQAIAKRLAKEGAKLVICDIGHRFEAFPDYPLGMTDELEARTEEIRSLGGEVLALPVDVSDEDSVGLMVKRSVQEFGGVDILINNAGVGIKAAPSLDWTVAEWDKVFAVNVRGTWLCCRAVAREMIRQRRGGRIINMSSQSARGADVAQPAYNASKAAVLNYSQSLTLELAPHGIRVNCVCPGVIDTQLLEMRLRVLHQQKKPELSYEQFKLLAANEWRIPLGRLGTAEDVAALVAFLVSSDADFITGQGINVNGGQMMV